MKIIHVETLISIGDFSVSPEWKMVHDKLISEISSMEAPDGSGKFLIYPECGKKRGKGNGVTPIKNGLMKKLSLWSDCHRWLYEVPLDLATSKKPGKIDAVLRLENNIIALEWETGNVSSSHRALNKMALGLLKNILSVGILVLPTKNFSQYLTDRVGNYEELVPYFDLWRSINCRQGILEIIAIEHDDTSLNVERISKGTDGRAIG